VNDDLTLLEQVDALDRKLAKLAAEIAAANEQLATLERALVAAQTAQTEAQAEVDRQKAEERATQRRLDELATSRKAALRVLETGVGNAEAAQRQLERCDELIDETESAMLEVLEAQDRAGRALEQAKAAAATALAQATRGRTELPAAVAAAQAEQATLGTEREARHKELHPEIRTRYDGFRARGRYALARIKSGGCEACGIAVQPQMVADLGRGRLVACHGCHRWLLPAS
jgi:predicted  nucleic acid-binding Zn-ribbon protein